MTSEKVLHFQNQNADLPALSQQIVDQLKADGYKTQMTTAPLGTIIQAQKAGIMRDILTADRCFTIMLAGQPNDFTIHVGIGKWLRDLGIAAVETILVTWLFLAVDVPEMLWTRHVEQGLIAQINQIVASPALAKTH